MEDLKLIKNLLFVICGLVALVLVLGYFALKKDNGAEFKALVQQNIQITHKLDSLGTTINGRMDSIKVLEKKVTNTKTIYQKDVYHVWTTDDKDSIAAIIRSQLGKLKSPVIE